MSAVAPTLQKFFTDRLTTQRYASPATVAAYRDAFRLLLVFVADRKKITPADLGNAEEALELERRKAFDDLRAEVSRLVVTTTAKVLARDLAESEKATLNKHAAEELARNN